MDDLKTYLEEWLSTQDTNLKQLRTNLVEKTTIELIIKFKIQGERTN